MAESYRITMIVVSRIPIFECSGAERSDFKQSSEMTSLTFSGFFRKGTCETANAVC